MPTDEELDALEQKSDTLMKIEAIERRGIAESIMEKGEISLTIPEYEWLLEQYRKYDRRIDQIASMNIISEYLV